MDMSASLPAPDRLLSHASAAALAAPFLIDGVDAMRRPDVHAARLVPFEPILTRLGLPPMLRQDQRLLSQVSGAACALAALGLLTGTATRASALALATFNVPVTVVNHPIWAARDEAERDRHVTGLLRGLALGAGLVVTAAAAARDRRAVGPHA